MTIDNLAERLARIQAAYADAPTEPPSQFDPPPDGDYQALVHEFDFFEGGTPKQAYLKIRFQVQHHPEHAGRFAEIVYSLEDPERIGYLKAGFAKLIGTDAANRMNIAVDCLPGSELLESLLDVPVLIRVKTGNRINQKTGKPYVGVYIEQRLGDQQQRPKEDPLPWDEKNPSDVPAPAQGEFEHPKDDGADHPFDDPEPGEGDEEAQRAALREAGCSCEDPLAPGGTVDCPIPGHADF